MDIQTVTTFFMWCTVIDGAILILCDQQIIDEETDFRALDVRQKAYVNADLVPGETQLSRARDTRLVVLATLDGQAAHVDAARKNACEVRNIQTIAFEIDGRFVFVQTIEAFIGERANVSGHA